MDITKKVHQLFKIHETTDPYKIAMQKGIIVQYADLGEINGFYIRKFNIRMILINQNMDEMKQQFTCAHELGHAILHPALPSLSLAVPTYAMKRESEANEFATKLLTYHANDYEFETKEQLLECFGISEEMERYV